MSIYRNDWKNWQDVASDFRTTVPEPEEVIFADYTYEDYSGNAVVVYRQGDRYYVVDGGHCSCYGLEDQWKPEEYASLDILIGALSKGWLRNSDVLSVLIARRLPEAFATTPTVH